MTTFLLFILLIIVAIVTFMIIKKNEMELGSKAEDILLEQARVLELQSELEQAELREQEQLDALRVEMQILERENAKNVLTLEKELAAAGLKGKAVQDALRKEMEESREIEQAKIETLQSQLNKTRDQEREKVKSLQYELDKSQARMSVMETNVEKLRTTSSKERGLSDAQIAELKKKLSEAKAESQTLQDEMKKKKEERTKASEELKTLQSELDELKKSEAEKLSTLQKKLGDSETTIEDLEDEIEELKNRAAEMVKSPDAGTQPSIVRDREIVSPGRPSRPSGGGARPISDLLHPSRPTRPSFPPPPPASVPSCKYEPFNPSKNYPGTHHDNYVKYCNDLISGDCAEELCKNTGAKNACGAECEAVMARPPPSSSPSPPTDGYVDNGLGFCKSGQIFASPGWALLNPGEPKKFASSFDDPVYKEYAKRGQAKCDADPNCKYVTVWRNAGYRMYNANAGNCSDKHDASGSNKSWKKIGEGSGYKPPPPKPNPYFDKNADLIYRGNYQHNTIGTGWGYTQKFLTGPNVVEDCKKMCNDYDEGLGCPGFYMESRPKPEPSTPKGAKPPYGMCQIYKAVEGPGRLDTVRDQCRKTPWEQNPPDGKGRCSAKHGDYAPHGLPRGLYWRKASSSDRGVAVPNMVTPPPPPPPPPPPSVPSCKYEPFNPSKNYPGTHPDNYVKYCNDLISGDCARELCMNTNAKNACKGECQAVMAPPPGFSRSSQPRRPPSSAPSAPPPPPPPPAKKDPWAGKKRFHEDKCDKVDSSLHGHEIFAKIGVEKGTRLAERANGGWKEVGFCQPDPKNSSAGRKLQVKMLAPTEKNAGLTTVNGERMVAKCPLGFNWKTGCTQECMYSSHPRSLTPEAWHGWSVAKDGWGREMIGDVVTKHQVKYPAIGSGVRKCCQKLGCPTDCKDPKVGGTLYTFAARITEKGDYKDLWNLFKGKYTLEKETGAKACSGRGGYL